MFPFRKTILFSALIALPLFGYLFWHLSAPSTLTDTLSPYEKAGEQVKESLSSLPALPITDEDTKYTIEDTLTEGIEITYPNQTNQEESGEEPKPSPARNDSRSDSGGLTLRFPKKYASEPMEVEIAPGKTILIQDKNAIGDYTSEPLALRGSTSKLDEESKGLIFWLESKLRGSTSESEKSYLSYTDPSKRITTYYAYGHDQATGEKQLKNWQVYTKPAIIKGESVAYSFTNAKLKKNEDGSIGVYYYGEQDIQNEKAKAEVDPSLMARAQRTLAKEMGDSINSGETAVNFTIPKPYYINAGGEKRDLDWRLSMDGKDISIDFAPEATEYPLALDPTLSFTAPGQSNTGDVITGTAPNNYFGYSFATGDFNLDGKTDLAVGGVYGSRAYIFYNDGSIAAQATSADIVIAGPGGGEFGRSLSSGDFDVDGNIDLAVGDTSYSSNTGRVHIFYNDGTFPITSATADVTITGEATGNQFGRNLTSGDFNADGKTDLVVGAHLYATATGRAYVFYNGAIVTENASTADVIITGETTGNDFGFYMTTGDLDADNKADLVVSAPDYSSNIGRVYIFYGDGNFGSVSCTTDCLASNADVYINGSGGNSLGVPFTGDFNADGKIDLVLGVGGYNSNQGRTYIFYGDGVSNDFGTATCSGMPSACSVTNADVTITGETSSLFGDSFSAGDFNGDGRTDLVVGARQYATSTGRGYIFYNDGSIPTTAATADVIITGEATNNYFGNVFATGDFNTDGKTDLVVGADYYNAQTGRTYIFYSQNGQVNTNQYITGNAASDFFGAAMTTGDFNADGKTDLAIGAPGYNPGGAANTGRVYIFYNDGSIPTTAATADVIITGGATNDNFGSSFALADLNADGNLDLVVGAPRPGSGNVYVFYVDGTNNFGTASCSGTPALCSVSNADITITGGGSANFGATILTGDFDASGTMDLAIGSFGYSTYTGRVYIFYNDTSIPTTDATADVTITGEATNNRFGFFLATADFNSDGKTDLVASASGYGGIGRVCVFYNGAIVTENASGADVIIDGVASGDSFGYAMTTGDFNTDGRIDLAVGSPNSTSGSRVSLFYNDGNFGTVSCTTDCLATNADITIAGTNSYLGRTLTSGDFNADGRTDLVAGRIDGVDTGMVLMYYNDGSIPTTEATADVKLVGNVTADFFSSSFAVGDLNVDGRADLIVGSKGYSSNTGRAYIYETRENFAWNLQQISSNTGGLRTNLNGTGQEMQITGEASSQFGYAMTTGDFNADGKIDLAVGASGYASNTGRVYIFYSDGSLSPSVISADVIISGTTSGDVFGFSLASGDINADGRVDIIASASSSDIGSTNSGSVYVFYNDGSFPALSANADAIIAGEATNNYFGAALAIEDFNSDGKSDIVASSLNYSTSTGRVYIFHNDGSYPSVASSADVIITGEGAGGGFGASLTGGDFNADGRIDIAAGANNYNSNAGRAYIFYNDGSIPTAAATAYVIISGSVPMVFGDNMISGDFNADGKTDIAIASPYSGGIRIFYADGTNNFGTAACTGSAPTTCLASDADVHITPESSTHIGVGSSKSMTSGDFNGDGRTDLAVGARDYSTNTGRTYIFYNDGSIPTTAATADVILTGESTSNNFGSALAAGDFNADGKIDLAVGADGYSSNKGRIYLYTFNDPVITGETTSNFFGGSLASGDFNADGKVDLVVRASGYSTNTGRVYIFYSDGSISSLASSADVVITGEATNNYFGVGMMTGDFNADGKVDLVFGAYGYSSNNGRAYIFYNGAITTESASGADEIITGGSGNQFGKVFASGDFNSDGTTDLAVGNNGRNVYIFYNDGSGSYPAADVFADLNIDDGGATSNNFGSALATGDFNDDGRVDLAIGSSYYFNYASTGRVYIFYNDIGGIPTTSAAADVTIDGGGGYFGWALVAGDFNADGKIDLASSAQSYNSRGRVYIFYTDGAPYPASAVNADVVIDGGATSYFGERLATGDLNADGRTDLIVSDTRAGGSYVGRVFVFYNDDSYPSTTAAADIVMNGNVANDYFSTMTTGDFNADGKTDLVVGAYGYSTNTGRVYIFTSEAAVKSIPDPVLMRGTVKLRGTSKLR